MRKENLKRIVASHKDWLKSNGKKGRQANLEGFDLRQVNLRNADLSYAILKGVNFERAELSNAILRNADLRQANICYASLINADLSGANLKNALAMGTDLTSANMAETILIQAKLDYALLQNANLTSALAHKTRFYRCNMAQSILNHADLTGANLKYVNLTSALVLATSFENANLEGALFTSEQGQFLASAQNLENTSDEDLSLEERQIISANRRLLKKISFIERATFWIAIVGITSVLLAGLIDLYAKISPEWSFVSNFHYSFALAITFSSIFFTTLIAFFRFKILESARNKKLINKINSLNIEASETPNIYQKYSVTHTQNEGK